MYGFGLSQLWFLGCMRASVRDEPTTLSMREGSFNAVEYGFYGVLVLSCFYCRANNRYCRHVVGSLLGGIWSRLVFREHQHTAVNEVLAAEVGKSTTTPPPKALDTNI